MITLLLFSGFIEATGRSSHSAVQKGQEAVARLRSAHHNLDQAILKVEHHKGNKEAAIVALEKAEAAYRRIRRHPGQSQTLKKAESVLQSVKTHE